MTTDDVTLARILVEIENIKADLSCVRRKLDDKYVTKDEFNPVRLIAFGIVGTISVFFLLAVAALLLKR